MIKLRYPAVFYDINTVMTQNSCRELLPTIFDLFRPNSVADVGCATGVWLSELKKAGVKDVHGFDGFDVKDEQLLIPVESLTRVNLASPPQTVNTQVDMAMSLEVAEHLPIESAESFVQFLTSLAPVVLFSAAIPKQGGVHHLNEQWQSYWALLFKQHGYVPVDAIRPQVWNNSKIEYWYRQNMIFYVKETELASYPQLQAWRLRTNDNFLDMVHPLKWEKGRLTVIDSLSRAFKSKREAIV